MIIDNPNLHALAKLLNLDSCQIGALAIAKRCKPEKDYWSYGLALARQLLPNKGSTYLEIGVRWGFSALIASWCGLKLHLLEVETSYRIIASHLLACFNPVSLKWHPGDSRKVLPKFKAKSIDIVYVDGKHNEGYPLSDLKQAVRIARKLVLMHDIHNPRCPACLPTAQKVGLPFREINCDGGLAVFDIGE